MKFLLQVKHYIIAKISFVINSIFFNIKQISVGKNFCVYGLIRVLGGRKRIKFGDNCILRSGLSTNPLGGNKQMVFALGKQGRIECGNNVGISNTCIRIDNLLVVEDNVNIGGDCKIYDSDMHSINYKERVLQSDWHIKSAPIIIQEGAGIGAHCIILKGVTIGARSVIGAGSVVTKNIPSNELWAGNPARFVRKINLEE